MSIDIIKSTNLNEIRKKIDSLASKGDKVIVLGGDGDFNKKILENKKVDMLVLNEEMKIRDYMKQRASGLNESLCKLAVKNGIKIGVDVAGIVGKNDVEKAKALARLVQNIMLCKKNKTELIVIGDVDNKDVQGLFLSLGASTSQAKKAIEESFFK